MKKMNKIKVKGERLKVKGLLILCLLSIFNFQFSICQAQSDSVLNRTITVERDFQPVIQAAGKVSTKPAIVETTIEPATAEYSDYTVEVQPEATFHPLLSQPTRFESTPPYNGYIRGALGHPNTLFDFGYHLDDGKRSILDIFAHHRAEWGLATLSKTKLGFDFSHPFSSCTLFFGLNGGNVFYHKYGHFYDYAAYTATIRDFGMWEKNSIAYPKPYTIKDLDKTSLWTMEAFVGVKANPKQDFQYCFQTGYMLFSKPGAISEHQIRTHADIDWHAEEHHVGINIYAQNNILQLTGLADYIPDSLYGNCHDIRLEPFYAYEDRRFRIHLGVNLDMNIGSGHNSLSSVEHLSFAPSPNIHMEAQIAKQWLTIYADVEGHHGSGSLQEYMEDNRYKLIHHGVLDHQFESYTPVDAELGFHIRPYRDLLLEIHGGYAYMINETNLIASTDTILYKPLNKKLFLPGDFDYFYADMQRGKIGGQINYHLQDKLRINLAGDYYFWNSDTTIYDRPDWEVALRIDGRIDKHWSLYSDNHFAGNRLALAYDGTSYTEHHLRPTVDLNLGVEYAMWGGKAKSQELKANSQTLRPEPKPNLTFFFQLNNWLHRKNEVYYGYRSQGINFLLGATFRF